MEILQWINTLIGVIFFVCYAYQFFYIPIPWLRKAPPHKPIKMHHYAVLICARNEEAVIADLIHSIHAQTYTGPVDVFVMADNCTDKTAMIAQQAGAVVYERYNTELVGKGYALQTLLRYLERDYPQGFDGYFVFDADNLLAPDYVEHMNQTFSDGYDIITSFRNSKNYGDSWISAGYALWFLRESRYLNHARFLLGTSCAVSGTGFLFSRTVLEEMGPWPFHLLTEDIEFSICQIIRGRQIAFCPEAVLYDEQPTSFRQSWRQRERWAKGYLQVFYHYGRDLICGKGRRSFARFDMSMSIMPAFILSSLGLVCSIAMTVLALLSGSSLHLALWELAATVLRLYGIFFLIGAITTITEWHQIHTTTAKKILYLLTFPLFMFTFLPISLSVFFRKVEWKPIEHHLSAASMRQRRDEEALPF